VTLRSKARVQHYLTFTGSAVSSAEKNRIADFPSVLTVCDAQHLNPRLLTHDEVSQRAIPPDCDKLTFDEAAP